MGQIVASFRRGVIQVRIESMRVADSPVAAEERRDTTKRILAAALEVFSRDGLGGTTREIARVAGVNEATLFRQFESKDHLLTAVTREVVRLEAEALAQKIETQHAGDLDNRVPTVDKKIIGSMGTFYRVRIGGYASQDEPRGICNKLRSSGLDCLVVTN